MRQYRRNLKRILSKNPKFAEAYGERAAEIATGHLRQVRFRSGALMLCAAIIGLATYVAARLVHG